MKLRVRYNGKTKVVTLPDEPLPTCSVLKRNIRESAIEELGLSRDAEFFLSLNGKTSVGDDGMLLKDAGLVSGDLLKIIFESDVLSPAATSTSSFTAEVSRESLVEVPSMMSVTEEEFGHDLPSTSMTTEDVPCLSPGPMLLQDCGSQSAEVPHILQSLYESDCIKNEFQALCLILHLMMGESGFSIEGHTEHEDVLALLQAKGYNVEYIHQAGRDLRFSLTCMSLGSFLLVNGVVQPCTNTEEQVLTLQLKLSDFVSNFNSSTKNSNAAQVYKNLSKLSHQFKENIAYQALNNMREELELPPIHGFLSLFPELLLRIFSNLDSKSLISISQVCKRFLPIADDDTLWRNLYIRDFKTQPESVQTTWKAMYKRKHNEKNNDRENKRIRQEMEDRYREYQSPWPQFPSPGQMPVPLPEQPFGMIGGEHDLNPSFPYGPFSNQPRNPRSMFPPNHPVHPMNPDNPLPGSRFDPMYPGGYRPGRGGGMMDDDVGGGMGMPFRNRNQRNARNRYNFM